MCKQIEEHKKDDLMNIYDLLIGYSACCKEKKAEAEKKIIEFCDFPESNEYKRYVGVRRIWQGRIEDCDRAIDAVYSGRIGSISKTEEEVKENGEDQNPIPSED